MRGGHIGEFEELVLLTVGVLNKNAYGVAIKDELLIRTKRKPGIGALHSALTRLENKGFLTSWMEDATEDRRGRRKRFYGLTKYGVAILQQSHEIRNEMFKLVPNLAGR